MYNQIKSKDDFRVWAKEIGLSEEACTWFNRGFDKGVESTQLEIEQSVQDSRWISNPKGDVCSLCSNFRWSCKCLN